MFTLKEKIKSQNIAEFFGDFGQVVSQKIIFIMNFKSAVHFFSNGEVFHVFNKTFNYSKCWSIFAEISNFEGKWNSFVSNFGTTDSCEANNSILLIVFEMKASRSLEQFLHPRYEFE